ncbi:hypothetical protein FJT64_027071 [Amphibalanus amphitrite]|uniref:Endonuclease/exonuclease/phosphatase domain-containing protein n=1 Tax=Amphibalanus amphitrite TaxID=1232801 RepID=A0A6A4WC14_AMPAM|nr:hypothetical protein FJT64_027071 [Amphibalanus amphitrite]
MQCQNVRSIRGQLGVLRAAAPALGAFNILALTETWLDASVDTSELEHAMPDHTWGQNVLDLVLSSADLQVEASVQDGVFSSDHKEVNMQGRSNIPCNSFGHPYNSS